jgi:hypothetical protein
LKSIPIPSWAILRYQDDSGIMASDYLKRSRIPPGSFRDPTCICPGFVREWAPFSFLLVFITSIYSSYSSYPPLLFCRMELFLEMACFYVMYYSVFLFWVCFVLMQLGGVYSFQFLIVLVGRTHDSTGRDVY